MISASEIGWRLSALEAMGKAHKNIFLHDLSSVERPKFREKLARQHGGFVLAGQIMKERRGDLLKALADSALDLNYDPERDMSVLFGVGHWFDKRLGKKLNKTLKPFYQETP